MEGEQCARVNVVCLLDEKYKRFVGEPANGSLKLKQKQVVVGFSVVMDRVGWMRERDGVRGANVSCSIDVERMVCRK